MNKKHKHKHNKEDKMNDLCQDTLVNIFLRLPLKTIDRLKCTSKAFHRIISDSTFEFKYLTRKISGLIQCENEEIHYFPLDPPISRILDYTAGKQHPLPKDTSSILAACNGLYLIQSKSKLYSMYNQVTKKQISILDPQLPVDCHNFGFGFGLIVDLDPSLTSSFSLVCIFGKYRWKSKGIYGFKIFSMETNKWRESSVTLSCDPYLDCHELFNPVYINGALHWLMNDDVNELLIAFHVETECVRLIEIPKEIKINPTGGVYLDAWFGIVKGLLNLVSVSSDSITVWVLRDYTNVEWQITTKISQEQWNRDREWTPIFFDGEQLVFWGLFIVEPYSELEYIGVYDTKIKRWKRIFEYSLNSDRHLLPCWFDWT